MDYSNEIWKDIKGYEGSYKISNFGRIESLNYSRMNKSKIILGVISRAGYRRVYLPCRNGKKPRLHLVHRLVAEAFMPNKKYKPFINHINANKTDNRVENLEWCTQSENIKHSFNIGIKTIYKNNLHIACILNTEQIKLINEIKGLWSNRRIAKMFKVCHTTINNIYNNKIESYS